MWEEPNDTDTINEVAECLLVEEEQSRNAELDADTDTNANANANDNVNGNGNGNTNGDTNGTANETKEVSNYKQLIQIIWATKGAPCLLVITALLSFGNGTILMVTTIAADRYARFRHGYEGPKCAMEPLVGAWWNKDYYSADEARGLTTSTSTLSLSTSIPEECRLGSNDAQSVAAISAAAGYLLLFVSSPLVGALSDRYGRKPFLLLGMFFFVWGPVALVVTVLVPSSLGMAPLYLFFVVTPLGNVTGGWLGVSLASMSEVLPTTTVRAPTLALLLAASNLAANVVPKMAVWFGPIVTAVVIVLSIVTAAVVCVVWMPETAVTATSPLSSSSSSSSSFAWGEECRGGSSCCTLLTEPFRGMASLLNRSYLMRCVGVVIFTSCLVRITDIYLLYYYLQANLGFTDNDIANLSLLTVVLGLVANTVFIRFMVDFVGEKRLLVFIMATGVFENLLYGWSATTVPHGTTTTTTTTRCKGLIYLLQVAAQIVAVGPATASSILSINVTETEQGRIQGVFLSVLSLSSFLGPPLFQAVYNHTKNGPGPGSMFYLAAFSFLVGTFFACALPSELANSKWYPPQRRQEDGPTREEPLGSEPLLMSSTAQDDYVNDNDSNTEGDKDTPYSNTIYPNDTTPTGCECFT